MTQRRRRFQSLFVLTAILLTPWMGRLMAQRGDLPGVPGADKQSAAGPAAEGPWAAIPANLHVDDDNAGAQDGSALRPFRTVHQAINAAKGDAVIAVAGGSYPENIRVQEKAVRLYGGYVGGTKADYAGGTAGNFKVRDPAAHASRVKGNGKDSVVTLYEAGASIVDGFLISGGGPSSVAAPSWLGGGFYIYQGTPTISHNVIEKNQTCPPVKQDQEAFGGGIYSTGATLSILNNIIRNNVSGRGAGIFADGPKLVIRGNTIQNNKGVGDHGGGAFLNSPNAEIFHNRVEGNEIGRELAYGWGGGMIVVNMGGHYKLSHNIFTGNFAPSLGAAFFADEGAEASLDHDLVYGNETKPDGEGGAIYVDGNENGVGSSITLNHVTIAEHTSTPMVKGSAVKATWNSQFIIKNSILWNNGGDDIEADEKSKATVTYTLSQETIKGTGNLSKDPLFVNTASHDYRLRQGSPAISAAEPASNGGRANLGADSQAAQAIKVDAIVKQTNPVVTPNPEKKAARTYLLRGTAGELPSEVGDDNTMLTTVESQELGGAALQIDVIDTFGQKVAKIADWTPFDTLRLDIVNKGAKELPVEFNLFHAETKTFATRVVAPFVLKPGKNNVRIAVKDLKNTNGTPAKLSAVSRWYVASEAPVRLLVGDIFLEGQRGSVAAGGTGAAAYTIKTDLARLERIKSTKMPAFAKPVPYNTAEADAIMSAAEIFPADNPWNTLVEDWPVHPNSTAIIASIGVAKPLRYNQDMAFVIVPPAQKKVDVKLILGPDESDPGPYPVADNTPIEGWPASFQQDPMLKILTLDDVQRGKPDLEQDRHGIVFDPAGSKLYEFYRLTKTDAGWHADGAAIFDLSSNKLRPDGWTSSDAAGLPILPAIVRYDEIKRGVIEHALRFTAVRSRRAYVYPATHFASKLTDENLPRMGERFRLREDFDTSKFSAEARVIVEALQRYGMFLADNGMDWGLSISGDERLPSFHDELRRIKGSDFEAVTPPAGYSPP